MKVTFEGIKYSYRQGKDGHVLAFVVHPANMPEYVALAPIGSRVMVTLTEITDEQPKRPEKPRQKWDSMKRSQQAGILCADPQFQRWLGAADENDVADKVRWHCIVESRSQLDKDGNAAGKWDDLVLRFRQATGQMAEQRG